MHAWEVGMRKKYLPNEAIRHKVSRRFFKKYFFSEKYDLTFNCIDRGNEVWIGFQCFIRCRFINEMIYLII